MVNLQANPFFLNDEQCAWVKDTLASLSLEEKLGQLICIVSAADSQPVLLSRYEKIPFGGITRLVEGALEKLGSMPANNLEDIFHADAAARRVVAELLPWVK